MKRINPYLELLAILGLITIAGFIINPEDPLWLHFSPSPYWIPLLLIALRYGSPAGLITGFVCAIIKIATMSEFSFNNLMELIYLSPQKLLGPGAFIAVGYYVSESMHSCQKKSDYYKEEYKKSIASLDKLEGERNSLEQAYRQIEGRVAGESTSLYRLLESIKILGNCEREDIPAHACSLACRFTGAQSCKYWLLKNNKWTCLYPRNDKATPPKLVQISAKNNKTVVAKDLPQETADEDCDLAGCFEIKKRAQTHILACENIGFSLWHAKLTDIFDAILHQLKERQKQVTLEMSISENAPLERELRLPGEAFLRLHVQKALRIQERKGGIASIFFLAPLPPHTHDQEVLAIIASALRCLLRGSDTMAYLPKPATFAGFMPETNSDGARIASNKVITALDDLELIVAGKPIRYILRIVDLEKRTDLDRILSTIMSEEEEQW